MAKSRGGGSQNEPRTVLNVGIDLKEFQNGIQSMTSMLKSLQTHVKGIFREMSVGVNTAVGDVNQTISKLSTQMGEGVGKLNEIISEGMPGEERWSRMFKSLTQGVQDFKGTLESVNTLMKQTTREREQVTDMLTGSGLEKSLDRRAANLTKLKSKAGQLVADYQGIIEDLGNLDQEALKKLMLKTGKFGATIPEAEGALDIFLKNEKERRQKSFQEFQDFRAGGTDELSIMREYLGKRAAEVLQTEAEIAKGKDRLSKAAAEQRISNEYHRQWMNARREGSRLVKMMTVDEGAATAKIADFQAQTEKGIKFFADVVASREKTLANISRLEAIERKATGSIGGATRSREKWLNKVTVGLGDLQGLPQILQTAMADEMKAVDQIRNAMEFQRKVRDRLDADSKQMQADKTVVTDLLVKSLNALALQSSPFERTAAKLQATAERVRKMQQESLKKFGTYLGKTMTAAEAGPLTSLAEVGKWFTEVTPLPTGATKTLTNEMKSIIRTRGQYLDYLAGDLGEAAKQGADDVVKRQPEIWKKEIATLEDAFTRLTKLPVQYMSQISEWAGTAKVGEELPPMRVPIAKENALAKYGKKMVDSLVESVFRADAATAVEVGKTLGATPKDALGMTKTRAALMMALDKFLERRNAIEASVRTEIESEFKRLGVDPRRPIPEGIDTNAIAAAAQKRADNEIIKLSGAFKANIGVSPEAAATFMRATDASVARSEKAANAIVEAVSKSKGATDAIRAIVGKSLDEMLVKLSGPEQKTEWLRERVKAGMTEAAGLESGLPKSVASSLKSQEQLVDFLAKEINKSTEAENQLRKRLQETADRKAYKTAKGRPLESMVSEGIDISDIEVALKTLQKDRIALEARLKEAKAGLEKAPDLTKALPDFGKMGFEDLRQAYIEMQTKAQVEGQGRNFARLIGDAVLDVEFTLADMAKKIEEGSVKIPAKLRDIVMKSGKADLKAVGYTDFKKIFDAIYPDGKALKASFAQATSRTSVFEAVSDLFQKGLSLNTSAIADLDRQMANSQATMAGMEDAIKSKYTKANSALRALDGEIGKYVDEQSSLENRIANTEARLTVERKKKASKVADYKPGTITALDEDLDRLKGALEIVKPKLEKLKIEREKINDFLAKQVGSDTDKMLKATADMILRNLQGAGRRALDQALASGAKEPPKVSIGNAIAAMIPKFESEEAQKQLVGLQKSFDEQMARAFAEGKAGVQATLDKAQRRLKSARAALEIERRNLESPEFAPEKISLAKSMMEGLTKFRDDTIARVTSMQRNMAEVRAASGDSAAVVNAHLEATMKNISGIGAGLQMPKEVLIEQRVDELRKQYLKQAGTLDGAKEALKKGSDAWKKMELGLRELATKQVEASLAAGAGEGINTLRDRMEVQQKALAEVLGLSIGGASSVEAIVESRMRLSEGRFKKVLGDMLNTRIENLDEFFAGQEGVLKNYRQMMRRQAEEYAAEQVVKAEGLQMAPSISDEMGKYIDDLTTRLAEGRKTRKTNYAEELAMAKEHSNRMQDINEEAWATRAAKTGGAQAARAQFLADEQARVSAERAINDVILKDKLDADRAYWTARAKQRGLNMADELAAASKQYAATMKMAAEAGRGRGLDTTAVSESLLAVAGTVQKDFSKISDLMGAQLGKGYAQALDAMRGQSERHYAEEQRKVDGFAKEWRARVRDAFKTLATEMGPALAAMTPDDRTAAESDFAERRRAAFQQVMDFSSKATAALKGDRESEAKHAKAAIERVMKSEVDSANERINAEIKVADQWRKNDLIDQQAHERFKARKEAERAAINAFHAPIQSMARGLMSFSYQLSHTAMQLQMQGAMMMGMVYAVVRFASEYEKQTSLLRGALNEVAKGSDDAAVRMKELEDGMRALGDEALRMSQVTIFGMTEIAEAQKALAHAGLTVNEIIAATPRILDLAAAGEMKVAEAALTAVTAMRQFGMSASEVGVVTATITAAAVATSSEVKGMAESLKYVGPIASNLGMSLRETTEVLGLLANAGIRGSMAGTTLRRMLTALVSPTGREKEVLERLGVQIEDTEGNFVGLVDVLEQLQSKLGQATNVRFSKEFMTLFQQRAGAGAAALVKMLTDDTTAVNRLRKEMDLYGKDQTVAEERTNSLTGSLDKLRNAFKALQVTIGEQTSGSLKWLIDSATSALQIITELTKAMGPAASSVMSLGLGLLSLGGILSTIMATTQFAISGLASGFSLMSSAVAQLGTGFGTMKSLGVGIRGIIPALFAGKEGINQLSYSMQRAFTSTGNMRDQMTLLRFNLSESIAAGTGVGKVLNFLGISANTAAVGIRILGTAIAALRWVTIGATVLAAAAAWKAYSDVVEDTEDSLAGFREEMMKTPEAFLDQSELLKRYAKAAGDAVGGGVDKAEERTAKLRELAAEDLDTISTRNQKLFQYQRELETKLSANTMTLGLTGLFGPSRQELQAELEKTKKLVQDNFAAMENIGKSLKLYSAVSGRRDRVEVDKMMRYLDEIIGNTKENIAGIGGMLAQDLTETTQIIQVWGEGVRESEERVRLEWQRSALSFEDYMDSFTTDIVGALKYVDVFNNMRETAFRRQRGAGDLTNMFGDSDAMIRSRLKLQEDFYKKTGILMDEAHVAYSNQQSAELQVLEATNNAKLGLLKGYLGESLSKLKSVSDAMNQAMAQGLTMPEELSPEKIGKAYGVVLDEVKKNLKTLTDDAIKNQRTYFQEAKKLEDDLFSLRRSNEETLLQLKTPSNLPDWKNFDLLIGKARQLEQEGRDLAAMPGMIDEAGKKFQEAAKLAAEATKIKQKTLDAAWEGASSTDKLATRESEYARNKLALEEETARRHKSNSEEMRDADRAIAEGYTYTANLQKMAEEAKRKQIEETQKKQQQNLLYIQDLVALSAQLEDIWNRLATKGLDIPSEQFGLGAVKGGNVLSDYRKFQDQMNQQFRGGVQIPIDLNSQPAIAAAGDFRNRLVGTLKSVQGQAGSLGASLAGLTSKAAKTADSVQKATKFKYRAEDLGGGHFKLIQEQVDNLAGSTEILGSATLKVYDAYGKLVEVKQSFLTSDAGMKKSIAEVEAFAYSVKGVKDALFGMEAPADQVKKAIDNLGGIDKAFTTPKGGKYSVFQELKKQLEDAVREKERQEKDLELKAPNAEAYKAGLRAIDAGIGQTVKNLQAKVDEMGGINLKPVATDEFIRALQLVQEEAEKTKAALDALAEAESKPKGTLTFKINGEEISTTLEQLQKLKEKGFSGQELMGGSMDPARFAALKEAYASINESEKKSVDYSKAKLEYEIERAAAEKSAADAQAKADKEREATRKRVSEIDKLPVPEVKTGFFEGIWKDFKSGAREIGGFIVESLRGPDVQAQAKKAAEDYVSYFIDGISKAKGLSENEGKLLAQALSNGVRDNMMKNMTVLSAVRPDQMLSIAGGMVDAMVQEFSKAEVPPARFAEFARNISQSLSVVMKDGKPFVQIATDATQALEQNINTLTAKGLKLKYPEFEKMSAADQDAAVANVKKSLVEAFQNSEAVEIPLKFSSPAGLTETISTEVAKSIKAGLEQALAAGEISVNPEYLDAYSKKIAETVVPKASDIAELKPQEAGAEIAKLVGEELTKKWGAEDPMGKAFIQSQTQTLQKLDTVKTAIYNDLTQWVKSFKLTVEVEAKVKTPTGGSSGYRWGGLISDASRWAGVSHKKMADGGGVLPGGYGGGDRIPILGEAGEFMIRKEAVKQYGVDFISALNSLKVPPSVIDINRLTNASVREAPKVAMATGGPVLKTTEPPVEGVYKIELGVGGRNFPLYGPKDVVKTLAEQLRRESLTGGGRS